MTRLNLCLKPACPLRKLLAYVCLGLLPTVWCDLGRGQAVEASPLAQRTEMTPQRRAELYQQLRHRAQLLEAEADVVKLAAKLSGPTVVHIDARANRNVKPQVGQSQCFGEAGAGVIVRWKGKHYVLTNAHVIHGIKPDQIKMKLVDGQCLRADRAWEDVESDVAVMAVAAGNMSDAPLGDSDSLEIGEYVLAVGSPFGLSHSVTKGIITHKGRRDLDLSAWGVRYQNFLQTDAAINPGNSGGPLLNLRGEVIAINTAFVTNSGGSQGIGFAIPINQFMRIAAQLIEHGKVRRGVHRRRCRCGVHSGKGRPVRAAPLRGGPGQRSCSRFARGRGGEFEPGNVILKYDSMPVENDSHLVNLVGLTEVGSRSFCKFSATPRWCKPDWSPAIRTNWRRKPRRRLIAAERAAPADFPSGKR